MKRLGVILGLLLLAGLVLVPATTAAKPERSFLPADDLELACPSFAVRAEIIMNKEYGIAFSDGRFLITGAFKVRLTNLSDPTKSLDANISGPGVFAPTPDGGFSLTAWGSWLFFFFGGELGPDSPAMLLLSHGLSTVVFDAGGNIVSFAPARNTTDACAALS